MSPLISNDLIFGALMLFIIVSIAANTLNYVSTQDNREVIDIVKNLSDNTNEIAQQNNQLLQLLENRVT